MEIVFRGDGRASEHALRVVLGEEVDGEGEPGEQKRRSGRGRK